MWQVQGRRRGSSMNAALEIRKIVRFPAMAIANLVLSQLAVQAAQAGIIIDRAALNTLNSLIGLSPQVQNGEIFATRVPPDMLLEMNVSRGIEPDIGGYSERVAGV